MRRFLIALPFYLAMAVIAAAAPPTRLAASEESGGSSGSPSATVTDELAGKYTIRGVNPNGSRYGGEVTITADGGVYDFRWRISNGDIYRGKGRLRDRTLTVDWGQKYPVIYRIDDNGILRGKWDNGRASEDLVPNR